MLLHYGLLSYYNIVAINIMAQSLTITKSLPQLGGGYDAVHLQNHKQEENKRSYFPLNNLFHNIQPTTALESFGKQLLIMIANLFPALSVSEILDTGGKAFNADLIVDFLKPIGAIITRQGTVDGINKKNAYKAILGSLSAVTLLGANKLFNMPRFLLRPVLAIFLFGIEELGKVKELLGYKDHNHEDHIPDSCHLKDHNESAYNHNPSLKELFTGLGILEVQLNTVTPIVSKLSNKIFETTGFVARINKVLFNTLFLSLGFVGLGEGLKLTAKHFSKSSNIDWLKDLSKVIGNTLCGCCGAVGACTNAAAEDISATANLS